MTELLNVESPPPRGRKPGWLKARAPGSPGYLELKRLVKDLSLHTVCESAICPNIGECWGGRTATFMILGDICTRSCAFCAIATGRPEAADPGEPVRVAQAVKELGLRHAVITSVNRDELQDGGASAFAETIRRIRERSPQTSVEVLIPDFQGDPEALRTVTDAGPDILNHNVETVPRLYRLMRPQARYHRSLELLRRAKAYRPEMPTKTGIMVGAGETWGETVDTIRDIVETGCAILTVGQYLQPSASHAPVIRYYTPEEFARLRDIGIELGIRHVESGPLVRSSYHAADQVPKPAPPIAIEETG